MILCSPFHCNTSVSQINVEGMAERIGSVTCFTSLLQKSAELSPVSRRNLIAGSKRRSRHCHFRNIPQLRRTVTCCNKMFVPGFSDLSPPEAKASEYLHHFFTYLAVRIVLAQLESYNQEAYYELKGFVDKTSLKDGDKFCASLMRESPRHKGLAMRILEVRSAYARQDFEWENLKKLSMKNIDKSNQRLMREYITETSDME